MVDKYHALTAWLPERRPCACRSRLALSVPHLPAMEMFVRVPEEIGWETFDLQACIPAVRRL
jgi:hypothetical protein